MQSEHISKTEAIEEIMLILAEFFKKPTEEFYGEIKSGAIEQRLTYLLSVVDINVEKIELKDEFKNYHEMNLQYLRCFSGVSSQSAYPVESIYKVWTTDTTAQVAHANSKGYLFGDSALHIRYLFEEYHLEIPEEYHTTPDHLTLLLEFLGFLVMNGQFKEALQFINDHFDWLYDFRSELNNVEQSLPYLKALELVIKIKEELTTYLKTVIS